METNNSVLSGPTSLLKQSIEFYKKHYKFLIALGLVPFALIVVSTALQNIIPYVFVEDASTFLIIGMLFVILVLAIFSVILQVLFVIVITKSVSELDKGSTSLDVSASYQSALKLFFPYFWINILLLATVVIPMFLLIIPGIILSVFLSFYVYAFVVDGKRGLSSLTTSFYYVKDNWWAVIWRSIFFLVIMTALVIIFSVIVLLLTAIVNNAWNIQDFSTALASVTGVSGVLNIIWSSLYSFVLFAVMYPISTIYFYLIYKNLKLQKPEPNPETDLSTPRTWFKWLSIAGAIILPLIVAAGLIITIAASISREINKGPQVNLRYTDEVLTVSDKSTLQTTPYIDSTLLFSISVPEGWVTEVQEDKSQGVVVKPAVSGTAVLQIQRFNQDVSTDEKMEQMAQAIISGSSVADPVLSKINIGDVQVYKISDSLNSDMDGGIEYYVVPDGKDFYVVTYGWNYESSDNFSQSARDSIATFKILK